MVTVFQISPSKAVVKIFQALQIQGASHVVVRVFIFVISVHLKLKSVLPSKQDVHLVEDISLRHNIFTNCDSGAVDIVHHQNHAVIRNIEIIENTFQDNHFG
jgi:hypothetical protein